MTNEEYTRMVEEYTRMVEEYGKILPIDALESLVVNTQTSALDGLVVLVKTRVDIEKILRAKK